MNRGMSELTYRITTLGCRVNHAEARDLEAVLRSRGLTPAPGRVPADLEVVHSCTVTRAAAAKSRNAIRRAARRQARSNCGWLTRQPQVFVTGCYATSDSDEAASIVGSEDLVVGQTPDDGGTMTETFAGRLDRWLQRQSASQQNTIRTASSGSSLTPHSAGQSRTPGDLLPLPVITPAPTAGRHIRAELRIQDGCDAHCTFCIIPKVRRTLRSKNPADAAAEARLLVDRGHREIVLTGIFIGAYGHETALRRRQRNRHASPLADLVDAVAQVPGLKRLRISSMEPGDVSEPLLDAMVANRPVVVPHLHLPLQSGSDAVLKRMNRQYRIGTYLEMIAQVNQRLATDDGMGEPIPPAITTDIICGFPGETEQDFQQTLDVAERVGYLHMHVFPYSSRPGTAAARWTGQFVDEAVKRQRVGRLIELETDPQQGLSIRYRRRLLGRRARVILEQRDRDQPQYMTGRCDHYAQVHVPVDASRGTIVQVQVEQVGPGMTVAAAPGPVAQQRRIELPVLSEATA